MRNKYQLNVARRNMLLTQDLDLGTPPQGWLTQPHSDHSSLLLLILDAQLLYGPALMLAQLAADFSCAFISEMVFCS